MIYTKSNDSFAVRIDRGEDVVSALLQLCEKENIKAGFISAIGAADHVEYGLYDLKKAEYNKCTADGQFEITSLIGNISRNNNEPYLHLHINFADDSGKVYGGHLNSCTISATCEMQINVFDSPISRVKDNKTGLNLFNF